MDDTASTTKSCPQILLVDDSLLMRTQVKNLLTACNSTWEIHEADSGAETLKKTLAVKPDLVVLDLNLPDMPGGEAALKIRQMTPSPKIVICSFNDDAYLAALAKDLGADAYFGKTSCPDELCRTVTALLAARN